MMKDYAADKLRNAPYLMGAPTKTSLQKRLYTTGETDRLGKVEEGNLFRIMTRTKSNAR